MPEWISPVGTSVPFRVFPSDDSIVRKRLRKSKMHLFVRRLEYGAMRTIAMLEATHGYCDFMDGLVSS